MAFANSSATSRKILSVANTATASGATTYLFNIPQDAQSIVGKFWTTAGFVPTLTNAAQCVIQTSEDGGSTWRDAASCTIQSVLTNDQAHFVTIPVAGAAGRGIANWVGSVGASSLAQAATASVALGIANGLPMMGTIGRLWLNITGTLSVGGVNVDIFAPTTDFTA